MSKNIKGCKNPNWKIGKFVAKDGIYLYNTSHPNCNKKGYVRQHRVVMENFLERFLKPKEIVHHINHNPMDNRIENLMLFSSNSSHALFHYYNAFDKLYK